MPDPTRTNPAMNLPNRQIRRSLMRQLREEQAGRSVPGYAEYLQQMEALDTMMENLSVRDSWGATQPLTAEDRDQLQTAIQQTAIAGERYLENVRTAAKTDPSVSMAKGTPAIVNSLQGMLSSDYETLRRYDPNTPESLPLLLERSRTRTLIIDGEPVDTMGGNQNARIPVTIVRGDGKKYRGMFTRVTRLEMDKKIDDMVEEAAADADTQAGAAEIRTLKDKLRAYKKAHDLEHLDDGRLFVTLLQQKTASGGGQRKWFDAAGFCQELGLNFDVIGDSAIRTFTRQAVRLQRNTADMISLADLNLREGARIDSRNSAVSAVSDMAGVPKLVAHAENMRFTDGQGKTMEGTIMDFSRGLDLNHDDEAFRQVNDHPFEGENAHKAFKQMADLQVVDYICGNIDRHAGNMMYLTNEAGEIVGVQGIDNDSSFGNFARGKKGLNRLPGTDDMNCVTKSMAKKVLEMDPHMLRFTLRGRGLSDREINYSVKRLKDLQGAIREGQEHYKDHPKITKDTEKPFDKGFIRTVSDEEFKALSLEKLAGKDQANLFSEVKDWIPARLRRTRGDGYAFDPEAKKDAAEKALPDYRTEGQTFTRETLMNSLDGADKLVKDGQFDIDSLTTKRRGGSQEFADMVEAAKKLAALKKSLADEQRDGVRHLSAAEYETRRRRIEEAEEEARLTSQTYLAQKMSEKKVRTLAELQGKNPYESARILQAKKIFEHTDRRRPAPEVTDKILSGMEGEALELKVAGELSAEEEARMAKEALRRLHAEHGLASPEEMKKLSGEEFNRQVKEAAERQQPAAGQGPVSV